jgi:hypothetical protein
MSCDTVSPAWHHVSESDSTEFSALRGEVNFCMRCKFCKRQGFIGKSQTTMNGHPFKKVDLN